MANQVMWRPFAPEQEIPTPFVHSLNITIPTLPEANHCSVNLNKHPFTKGDDITEPLVGNSHEIPCKSSSRFEPFQVETEFYLIREAQLVCQNHPRNGLDFCENLLACQELVGAL